MTRLFRTVAILASAVVLAMPATAKEDALSLVPADAVTVGMVRLADMRTSPLSSVLFQHVDRMSMDGEAERFLLEAGIQPTRDVDTVVRYGFGRRYAAGGPFELGALISADVRRAVAAEIMPDLANSAPATDRGAYSLSPEEAEQVRLRVAHALLEIAKWDASER